MESSLAELPSLVPDDWSNPADRRAHRRVHSSDLAAPIRIRIPHRPDVSLVDLSAGGALIELPFQMRPASRIKLELWTPSDRLTVPFELLRCHVADLRGGVRYQAAGAFDGAVDLPPGIIDGSSQTPFSLIAALEALLRASRATELRWRDPRFDELVLAALSGLRRNESTHLITVKIKAYLTQRFPSLSIHHSPPLGVADPLTTARFFGLDFTSRHLLTAPDRRLLRAAAQVIAMIEESEPGARRGRASAPPAPEVVRSPAEWLMPPAARPVVPDRPSPRPRLRLVRG